MLRLISVEQRRLEADRPGPDLANGDRPLQDLRQMMVYRVADDRPHHRVVGPEGHEPLPDRDGCLDPSKPVGDPLRPGKHQLVHIGMGVSPVDESLAPGAEGELTIREGETFQIHAAHEPNPVGEHSGLSHEHRLHQPQLGK